MNLCREAKQIKDVILQLLDNNNNVVVEVNHQMATNWMYYRVGLVAGNQIQWGDPSAPRNGSGASPRVCLNDTGYSVEVHKGQYLDRCFCRVGRVHVSTRGIRWGSRKYFNIGLRPAAAINNKNTVVAVFQDNKCLHKTPQLSSWLRKQQLRANGVVVTVDINNNDLAVLAYQTSLNHIQDWEDLW